MLGVFFDVVFRSARWLLFAFALLVLLSEGATSFIAERARRLEARAAVLLCDRTTVTSSEFTDCARARDIAYGYSFCTDVLASALSRSASRVMPLLTQLSMYVVTTHAMTVAMAVVCCFLTRWMIPPRQAVHLVAHRTSPLLSLGDV